MPKPWDSKLEVQIGFEVFAPDQGFYRRPYVAIWIEDKQGKTVRTLNVWYQQGRGNRWLRDLRVWMRAEQARRTADGDDISAAVSGPTRQPGKYSLIWDGKDNHRKAVEQGEYFVCIEAAREHGGYQLLRKSFSFGIRPLKASLGGEAEITGATVELRKKR